MAIGRISGSVLKSNLTRNGVDLAFETNLLYLDVTNSRVGIGTSEPSTALTVNGTATVTTLAATSGNTLKGQPTLGNDMMSLGFGAPNGEIKSKNTSGSPASNVDIHTTNSSGTTARVFRATHDGNIQLMSGDTVIGKFSNSSSDFVIENDVQDKDIIFKGDDNGSSITALTLDMSEAGAATFNDKIILGTNNELQFVDTNESIKSDGSKLIIKSGGTTFNLPTSDGSANQVLMTNGSGTLSFGTVSTDSLATGGITYDDNKITGQRSNENIEIEANGSGVIETASSIIPKTDNSIDLGSSSKRFREGYFAAGTVHIGDQTIKSTSSGFVFSGHISTQGAQVTTNDDNTAQIVRKSSIPNSETTIESYATSANDSVLYYLVSRDQVNNEITAQKVSTVHNNTTGFASTTHVTKTGTSTDMTFDGSISGGSMRLRATGGSFSNSITAYKISLGDSSSAGTSGNTAIVINTDVDSVAEGLDSWAHASYRGAKYFISVNDEADDELETMEVMLVHNGTDAFLNVYNNVRTGSNSLITLTADIDGSNVRLLGQGSRANLNVKMHRILLSDSETAYTGDQMAIIPATTVSSSLTTIDTFNVNNINAAYYYVVGTVANGDSSIVELTVATNGTDAYITTGPTVSTEGTDQLSFTSTISGDIITISAASSSGASTTVNAYRINLKRDNELDVTDTMSLSGSQSVSGNKTFTDSTELKFGTDGDANIKHTGTNLNVNETTGDINIRTYANDKDVKISTDDGSGGITEYVVADGSSGAVKLKHYGTTVFETTSTGASITNTSTSDALLVTTTEDSNTAGPVISLKRNSSSPADADYIGQIKFKGENDNDQEVNYAKITGKILDASDGSEDGILEFAFMKNGSQNISGRFRSDSLQLLNDTNLRVTGHVELGVLASDPNTTTDIAQIYAKDESASAEVFVQDEAGNVTKISPHNEKGEWEYYSRNKKTGKTVRVNMEEMIRDIEKLTGKKYIKAQ
jgi:hypothetical protein